MPYDPERHHRRSIRLPHYDYRFPGAYFVTICIQDRACLLGEVVDCEARLSRAGVVIDSWWGMIPGRFPHVALDAYVVMPNHLHGVILTGPGADGEVAPSSLSDIMYWFKSATTADYRRGVMEDGWPPFPGRLWQRNYYEHVVRDDRDLDRIRAYIAVNPARWGDDEEHPLQWNRTPRP